MENNITISSHEEFIEHTAISNESDNNKQNICYISHPDSTLIIDYEIGYNFVLYLENKNVEVVNFSSCTFNFPLAINEKFAYKVEGDKEKTKFDVFGNIEFVFGLCKFKFGIQMNNFTYNRKIKFWRCEFEKLDVYNASFNKLFEIFDSQIYSEAIFNKVDFNANCVFTKTQFYKNCMFTYSTFEKQGIFSRSIFKDLNDKPKGLDLSQSIINGQLTFFETELEDYDIIRLDINDKDKFDELLESGENIPIQNKRETFRIIKHQLLQQKNVLGAEKYAKLEKQTLFEEKNLDAIYEDNVLKTFKILLSDYFVLKLNKYSNNFKTSWLYAFIFTLSVAFISHSFLSISKNYEFDDFIKLIKLINITDFSFYEEVDSTELYIVYFLAKISIGFGIYQLIQAFRKCK